MQEESSSTQETSESDDNMDSESEMVIELDIPTVSVETENSSFEVIELYELPSGMVMEMLAAPAPVQIRMLSKMLRLAIVETATSTGIDEMSFNELTEVLYQWYSKSPMRIAGRAIPQATIEDMLGGPPEE